MNVLQAVLNVLPLGGVPLLVVDDYQKILQAFQQMPHLDNAVTAVFQANPNIVESIRQLQIFFRNEAELRVFVNVCKDLGINIGVEVIKTALQYPLRVVNSIATAVGNFRTAIFGLPAGSIRVIAQ